MSSLASVTMLVSNSTGSALTSGVALKWGGVEDNYTSLVTCLTFEIVCVFLSGLDEKNCIFSVLISFYGVTRVKFSDAGSSS